MPESRRIVRGGQLIRPAAVEEILRSHAGVAEVSVVGVPDLFWDEIVAAAVVTSGPLAPTVVELTEHCRTRLAPYEVPVRWLFTTDLPRTAAGEVCQTTVVTELGAVLGLAQFQPRAAAEELRIPAQVRRSRALEDLDYF
jgi:acyl-CoA synthetase (AMP-forming)/AMP-acid ligase II